MKIKVAVFGAPDLVELVMLIGKQFEDLDLLQAVYSHPDQVTKLVEKYHKETDILLFAAPVPYLLVRDYLTHFTIELNKPMIFIPYTEASFYRGLFMAFKQTGLSADKLNFSIDYLPETGAKECLEELEINAEKMYEKKCKLHQDLDKLFSFHYDLWKQGKTATAMTSYYLVYEKLKKLGIPAFRVTPAKSAIRQTLQQVLLEGKSLYQVESQIAIVIIGFSQNTDKPDQSVDKQVINRREEILRQIIAEYEKDIQALSVWTEQGNVRLITTRGEIEQHTQRFRKFPMFQSVHTKLNIPVFCGIGFGHTANEAELKAYEAFSKARSTDDSNCFVVESDGKVHGPIGKPFQLEYAVRSKDPGRLLIAKQTGLSIGTINKLISFNESCGNQTITAGNLADGFGITSRSARRILSKLEQHNFAQIIGEEQPVNKGRPRQIYKLILD
ncbi:hypothetical protein [Pseudobacillus wudalianchiensis]|uniref:Transcriptional regulator n=1 Tax=Pseudobacillus wudalianchiensis TaxID=1743143 RepID=A0A1B9B8C9_9BACI|nr:hypothetical protein [Bacillus wudalianchiensis]OCA92349.1 hypothetical protein A8F95_01120 [Bacillus wudalianchiensis]